MIKCPWLKVSKQCPQRIQLSEYKAFDEPVQNCLWLQTIDHSGKTASRHPNARILIFFFSGVNAVWAVRRSVLGWQRVTSHWLPELSVARYCGWWQWSSHGRVDKHSEETERERTQALSGMGPQGGVMLYTFTGRSQGEKVHMPTLLGSVFHSLSQMNCCLLW